MSGDAKSRTNQVGHSCLLRGNAGRFTVLCFFIKNRSLIQPTRIPGTSFLLEKVPAATQNVIELLDMLSFKNE
ncbi:hypothetical protein [Roseibium sp. MMSF_3544]|uniref:hypothetical protein n=1 Tax=unclassified Roseibium TaxID=2629323 RepID=UPI00273F2C59|nr:hypothetical protein [Roseibium sp. MMSF_3544]